VYLKTFLAVFRQLCSWCTIKYDTCVRSLGQFFFICYFTSPYRNDTGATTPSQVFN